MEEVSRGHVWGWPRGLRPFANYTTVLTMSHMPRFIVNSVLVAVPAVLGTIALSSMAGFALAKHDFRGNTLLLMLFVGGNLVPFQMLMIPAREACASARGALATASRLQGESAEGLHVEAFAA